ncbi:GNAT family N-acetyltransferase [Kribbella sp. NBC_01510]|uniref:GNAT family N-acetyltransferase n=1 Tax=Kribbella sp. NBC_01510 TaxID=2903581 RepID=UPI003869EF01
MDELHLRAAADRNVEDAVEHFARYGDRALSSRRAGTLLVASATNFVGAFHNAALRVAPDTDPRRVLDEARAFGRAHGRAIVLWADTHRDYDLAAQARTEGLLLQSTALGMALHTPPPAPAVPRDTELLQVMDRSGVDEFVAVHRSVFRDGGRYVGAVDHFASPGALLTPNVAAVVARVNGTPVSCAMVIHSGRAAGIYWVATTAAARNRGLGTLVTGAVARMGFEYGADIVVLQATELGAPVYRRMGFVPFTDYQRFLVPWE